MDLIEVTLADGTTTSVPADVVARLTQLVERCGDDRLLDETVLDCCDRWAAVRYSNDDDLADADADAAHDAVHDDAAAHASSIAGDGIAAQVAFVVGELGVAAAEAAIRSLAR